MYSLSCVVDHSCAYQFHQTIAEHLSMYAQVFMVDQSLEHGIGNFADAHLQGGTIFNQHGDIFTDFFCFSG